ncbi:Beta-glucosidase [Luteimicrobium xylanilyticum]|uniref:Beta-glucosidase n=1 Tax=Luteimicrobium xylanilyticum TaxID=1133546 RepID=A0A5P9QDD0_9MICO|nr:glycoside hydrolase family 3 N-terminal domain-containing protein [Luteimicrobium xylanilyticum]QFU99464.1 Beta-glucosidase [Luteimicrobium xylanilyticum]
MSAPSTARPGGSVDEPRVWQDVTRTPDERVEHLVEHLTLEEKVAQLVGVWVGADASGGGVAPHQADMTGDVPTWEHVIRDGLGQLTRPFGTAPVDPASGARSLAASQRDIVARSRFGIPAQVHEECLAGFAAWQATAYPVPLSWGASFDPALVREMAQTIGASMRSVGVHQGLAPVLDVTRDPRWGRTEETIGEDPYLVATVGSSYVRGLEDAGIVATLKHFAGYAASRAGRNLAPVDLGPAVFADVVLPPFEAALRLGGARSVMHSYAAVDGVPAAADESLLTGLLRETWGFDGTVVADYFGVRFLETLHKIAADRAEASRLALEAGVDVELPTVDAFGVVADAVRAGEIDELLVDRALRRVLRQKLDLGLLDADWSPDAALASLDDPTLDTPAARDLALRLARESVVLLANPRPDGAPAPVLPLAPSARLAVVGPLADDPMAMLGCYSFPAHVGAQHPETPLGIEIPTVAAELRARCAHVSVHTGCEVTDPSREGFAEAVAAARGADVCVAVVGDRAGLFGRGTSGEGCDAEDLRLPGVQADLLDALLATGTPVVVVLLTGRPYALGEVADRAAAVVQAFFPGQRGGQAVAEVLAGETNPSGRLPVSVPARPGGQPGTYLAEPLARRTSVSSVDPTALYPFGHGLSYTTFAWEDARLVDEVWPTDGEATVRLTVRNTGERAGADVVQLYLHDPVAQRVQPEARLVGYARVDLEPGQSADVELTLHADLTSFTGRRGVRVVEPGDVELRVARSSADVVAALGARLTGPEREVGHDRRLVSDVVVHPATATRTDHQEVTPR